MEEKLSKFNVEREVLVVPEGSAVEGETDLDVWDVERMCKEALKVHHGRGF